MDFQLDGVGILVNMSHCLSVDENFIYILGSTSPPEVASE